MVAHWISPFRTDKNIGLAINEAITTLAASPEDWIIHVDQDVLFLQPDTKAHILNILETTDYDVLGCMTNRLGLLDQVFRSKFEEDSISVHVKTASEAFKYNGDLVVDTDCVAAMLMCFKVSTWQRVGGFDEGKLSFDSLFCHRVKKLGLQIGVMRGIYIFHLYRWNQKDPQNYIKHLKV